jgi:hypothetical protein
MTVRDKKILDKCYQKCRQSKVKKETDRETALRVAPELKGSPKEGIIPSVGNTRNQIMMECKARGVKNYRVLNKQELTNVLKDIGNQKYVNAIVAGAVARWKAGWGKGKGRS